MEAKFQVFISSTSDDLKEFREIAEKAILGLRFFPIDMKYFTPTAKNALQVCYDAVQKADMLIGIYAHRYGYAPDASVEYRDTKGHIHAGDGKRGITEWEYHWALERGIPLMLFVIDKDAPWDGKLYQFEKKAELEAFKAHIGKNHTLRFFKNITDFATTISIGLSNVMIELFGKTPTPEQAKIQEQHAKDSDIQPPRSPVIEKIRRVGSLPKLFTQDDFFDRTSQQADITNAIRTGKALIAVTGRGGVGKTALMCKVLGDFEKHTPPADGLAYFRANDTQTTLTAGEILAGLSRFLPPDHPFHETRKDITLSVADKTRAFIEAVHGGRYIVYIDNLESIQFTTPEGEPPSPDEGHIIPTDMRDFLATVLALGDNRGMSVVITSRVPLPFGNNPLFFNPLHSGAIKPLRLDEGLPLQEGIAFMKSIKHHDNLPDDAQLALWHAKVNGFPRGLEALIGYLNQSETRHIQDLLDDPRLFGENVLSKIVAEVIATLSTPLKQVLGAVSVIGQATSQADLEYALAPHANTAYLRHALDYLVDGRYLAYNGQTRTYSLHPLDMAYIHEVLLPEGEKPIIPELTQFHLMLGINPSITIDETAFTRYALAYRMAKLYEQKRRPTSEWRDLNDLTAHLREMEYRLILGDYDTVADMLTDMDFNYLLVWGHTELVLKWHTRLEGKVKNPDLAMRCIGNLGTTYYLMGAVETAIGYYQRALNMARTQGSKQGEGALLGGLGNAYSDLGQVEVAIGYYQDALNIAREIKDKRNEGALLGGLGNAYSDLGQVEVAIGYYQDALNIAREIKYRGGEGIRLGNLGNALTTIGRYAEAVVYIRDSINISEEIKSVKDIQYNYGFLARAYWFMGNMPEAHTAIRQAREYDVPINNHAVASIHGCIAYCMGQTDEAQTAFTETIAHADGLLSKTANQYGAMYYRALALAGLWLVTGDDAYQAQSQTAYHDAKTVNRDAGTLLYNRQLLEKLLACGNRNGADLLALLA